MYPEFGNYIINLSLALRVAVTLLSLSTTVSCSLMPSKQTPTVLASELSQNPEQNHGFTDVQDSVDEWWNIPYPKRFDTSALKPQSRLAVKGNRIINEKNDTVVLRGVNIADPFKLVYDKRWNKQLFEEVDRWGANVIRVPVHPLAWRKQGRDWYFDRIDEAVLWANEFGIYLIIDWHSIGNLKTELFQHPMYRTDMAETSEFWRQVAYRYRDVPAVAVYEIFNEPTDNFIGTGTGSLGKVTWAQWRVILEDLVDLVKLYNKDAIPLVGGFNWAYDLSPVADHPLRREGIAYAVHPYPQKAKPKEKTKDNFFALWEEKWGFVAQKYPLLATELGWVNENGKGAHVPVIHNEGTYGPNIVEYMDARNMGWTVWIFDPDWSPVMISDWDFTPTEQGEFFRMQMKKLNKK